MITYRYTLDRAYFITSNQRFQDQRPVSNAGRAVIYFVSGLAVVATIRSLILHQHLSGLVYLGLPVLFAFVWLMNRWGIISAYRQSPYRDMEVGVRFDEDGMTVFGASFNGSAAWNEFHAARRYADGFLLIQSAAIHRWLPHSALTEGSVEILDSMLREYIADYRTIGRQDADLSSYSKPHVPMQEVVISEGPLPETSPVCDYELCYDADFQITAFHHFMIHNQPWKLPRWVMTTVASVVLAFLGIAATFYVELAAASVVFALLIVFLVCLPTIQRWRMRKAIGDKKEYVRIWLDEEGLYSRGDTGHEDVGWHTVTAATEHPTGITIVRSPSYYWLPDSGLVSGTPADAREFIRTKVAKYERARSLRRG